jgi:glycosyltransferase involved in cell wall biosynthesis
MLLQGEYDGDARVKREARSLVEDYGVRVIHLAGQNEAPSVRSDGAVTVEALQVATRRLPRSAAFWLVKYVEFVVRVALRAARTRPRAYHAHDLPMVLPALLAARLHPAPVVYDAHELYADMGGHGPVLSHIWRRIDRFVLPRVARVIAVNASRARVMVEELGAPEPVLVPNLPHVRPPGSLPPPEASPLRRFVSERGAGGRRILLYQGLVAPGRSLDVAVRAMARVQSEAVLVILGPHNAHVDELLSLAKTQGVANRVLYHERVASDALPEFTVGADAGLVIYANAPRNNYLCAPNKLFDYCMAGIPVVGCDLPEVRRLLEAHDIGELFAPSSPASLAAATDRLLGDPERLQAARRATAGVRARHHWGVASEALRDLYGKLLGSSAVLR